MMLAQLKDATTNRVGVAEQSSFEPTYPNANSGLDCAVLDRVQPFGEGLAPVFRLVSEDFNHVGV